MRIPSRILPLLLPAILVMAGPGLPQGMGVFSDRLSGFKADHFMTDRSAIAERVRGEEGEEPDPANLNRTRLNLARLHLSHGLWTEASGLLGQISPDQLPSEDREDWARSRILAALFDPVPGASRPDPASLLPQDGSPWPDAALFRSLLGQGGEGDLLSAELLIRPYPVEIRFRALPVLLEHAIEAEDWGAVRALAEQVRSHPGLNGSSADLFLQGFAAERAGLLEEAISAYERAGEGSDLWAQRARLSWADLAASSGLREAQEIHAHLARTRTLWRGGELGLGALTRLYRFERDGGDPLAALDLLSEVRTRHPERADEVASEEERWRLTDSFYRMGERGETPFGRFLEGHLRLFRDLSTDPRYLDLAEAFAERLAGMGAYGAAAEELGRIRDTLLIQNGSARSRVPPERMDRVRVRLAEVLLEAGQPERAEGLLRDPALDPALSARMEKLRARAFTALGDPERVLTTWVSNPDPEHLRLIAKAHHALEEWAPSRRFHLDLIRSGAETNPSDMSRLVAASFRSGELHGDAGALMGMGADPLVIESLLRAGAPLTEMRRDAIESHLGEAEAVITLAQDRIRSNPDQR
jgi:tetratricopeptide (TPR) repeat protein